MKALITGAGGGLGSHLAALLPDAQALDRAHLDVADEDAVWKALTQKSIDVIFHCAAMSDVDGCERDPVGARRSNASGARHVAGVAGSLGIYMVFVSTDYVFDGSTRPVIDEDSPPQPLSVYGRTKLSGEEAVSELCAHHAVVRTSWLFGGSRPSFVKRVIDLGMQGKAMEIVSSQISSPTWVEELAPALISLAKKRCRGTFHLTNEGHVSRDDWARSILEDARLDPELVRTVSRFPSPAKRPIFSALSNTRARAHGITLGPWRAAQHQYISSDPAIRDRLSSAA
jgi:dTDP-4-dehydrorhamnose reductase